MFIGGTPEWMLYLTVFQSEQQGSIKLIIEMYTRKFEIILFLLCLPALRSVRTLKVYHNGTKSYKTLL
jgi:hypothetical protein